MSRDDLMREDSEALVFTPPRPSPNPLDLGRVPARAGGVTFGGGAALAAVGVGRFVFVFCFAMMFLDEMNYSNKPCSIALAIALVRLDTLSFS